MARLASRTLSRAVGQTICAVAILGLSGCATHFEPPTDVRGLWEAARAGKSDFGYLARNEWVNSVSLLDPAPRSGSAAEAADLEAHRALAEARSTIRWALAIDDADVLSYPRALHTFSCIVGFTISEHKTPHLNMLLMRSGGDAGMGTVAAKEAYKRIRPFVALGESTCTPQANEALAKDGSYPSGHAALGWMWGALLAGLVPEHGQALIERGTDFGRSRMVCGVHWKSDVLAGQATAAATLARLQASEVFMRQRERAREEVRAARAAGPDPALRCDRP